MTTLSAPCRAIFACLALSTFSLSRADVLIVRPGGMCPQIQTAVNFANDGDTILVRSGTYSAVTIDGKSLTIAAELGHVVNIAGTTVVKNLAAGKSVVLSGLKGAGVTIPQIDVSAGVGLYVTNNAGPVRVQSCEFTGAEGYGMNTHVLDGSECCYFPLHGGGWDGALVEDNASPVEFSASTARGGSGTWANTILCWCGEGEPGGDGLHCVGSRVALYDCTLAGGCGGNNGSLGGIGGSGCRTQSGAHAAGVFASGSSLLGGDGGRGSDCISAWGGDGGVGLNVGSSTVAQLVGNATSGGSGGPSSACSSCVGQNGAPTSGTGSTFTFNVSRVAGTATRVVRGGSNLTLNVVGIPGDVVYALSSRGPAFEPVPSWRGVVLADVAPQSRGVRLGTIPASGTLSATIAVPSSSHSTPARTLYLQIYCESAGTGITLGSLTTVTILDPSL